MTHSALAARCARQLPVLSKLEDDRQQPLAADANRLSRRGHRTRPSCQAITRTVASPMAHRHRSWARLGCAKRLIHVSRACCTELGLHPSAWATASPVDATAWGPGAAWVSANKDVRVGVSAGGRCMGRSCHRAVQRDVQRDAGQPLRAPDIPAPEWDAGARSVSVDGAGGRRARVARHPRASARPQRVARGPPRCAGAHPRHPKRVPRLARLARLPRRTSPLPSSCRLPPPRAPPGVDGASDRGGGAAADGGSQWTGRRRVAQRGCGPGCPTARGCTSSQSSRPREPLRRRHSSVPRAGRVGVVGCATRGSVAGAGAAPADGPVHVLSRTRASRRPRLEMSSNARKHPTSVGLPSSLTAFEGGAMVLSFVLSVWVVCHGRFREFSLHR
jgi:hypothetical protein